MEMYKCGLQCYTYTLSPFVVRCCLFTQPQLKTKLVLWTSLHLSVIFN